MHMIIIMIIMMMMMIAKMIMITTTIIIIIIITMIKIIIMIIMIMIVIIIIMIMMMIMIMIMINLILKRLSIRVMVSLHSFFPTNKEAIVNLSVKNKCCQSIIYFHHPYPLLKYDLHTACLMSLCFPNLATLIKYL